MRRMQLALGVAVLLAPGRLEAQGGTPPDSAARAPAVAVATPRQSWLSDRLPLRVGDLITIVVDESTDSRERSSNVARSTRSRTLALGSPVRWLLSFSKGTRGTSTWISIRSSRGPEIFFW